MRKKIRRKINRSNKAFCEVCKNKGILTEHHIEGKDIPNPNHSSNLCNICPNCHTNIHFGIIQIEKWVQTSNGKELIWHIKGEDGFTEEEAKPYIIKPKD